MDARQHRENRMLHALDGYFYAPDVGSELRALEAAVQAVDDLRAQQLVHAVEDHGMTHGQVARVLDVSRRTIINRLQAARALLAEPRDRLVWPERDGAGGTLIRRGGGS